MIETFTVTRNRAVKRIFYTLLHLYLFSIETKKTSFLYFTKHFGSISMTDVTSRLVTRKMIRVKDSILKGNITTTFPGKEDQPYFLQFSTLKFITWNDLY